MNSNCRNQKPIPCSHYESRNNDNNRNNENSTEHRFVPVFLRVPCDIHTVE